MKNRRKYLALIIAAVLTAGLCLPAYAAEEYTMGTAETEYDESLVEQLKDASVTENYDGGAPDLSLAARQRVTALPEAGTYEYGQLLVKVANSGGLQAESLQFGGIAEYAEPLFSVPAAGEMGLESESN